MPDGIDAADHGMQSGAGEPVLEGAPPDAAAEELPARNDAVLGAGELRDQLVDATNRRKDVTVMVF